MQRREAQQIARSVLAEVESRLPAADWRFELLPQSQESVAVRLVRSDGASFVFKVAPHRYTDNDNDADLDFLRLYEQEHAILTECALRGLPVPGAIDVFLSDVGLPVLLLDYVTHDGTKPGDEALGRLARQLHEGDWDGWSTVAMRGLVTADAVCGLILQRLAVVRRLTSGAIVLPPAGALADMLEPISRVQKMLHLDLRADNVLCIASRPCCLLDWANAMVGDPLLELARVAEYGLLTDEFVRGYGDRSLMAQLETPLGLACRLYTAAMMTVLFMSEIPDRENAAARLERLQTLLSRISFQR